MSSPFPHMQAQQAAREAADDAKHDTKVTAWESMSNGCWRAALIFGCLVQATVMWKVFQAYRESNVHITFRGPQVGGFSNEKMVRRELIQKDAHFFLDIGMSSSAVKDALFAKHLEQKGWSGVCAVPFPGDFSDRMCKVVAVPVSPTSGQQITLPDCSHSMLDLKGPLNMLMEVSQCRPSQATAVSIEKLLTITSAPKHIDFIALSTLGTEMEILLNFPFHDYCVSAWSVSTANATAAFDMDHFFNVAQGCRVLHDKTEMWARCPCVKNTNPHNTGAVLASAGRSAGLSELTIDSVGTFIKHHKDVAPHIG